MGVLGCVCVVMCTELSVEGNVSFLCTGSTCTRICLCPESIKGNLSFPFIGSTCVRYALYMQGVQKVYEASYLKELNL